MFHRNQMNSKKWFVRRTNMKEECIHWPKNNLMSWNRGKRCGQNLKKSGWHCIIYLICTFRASKGANHLNILHKCHLWLFLQSYCILHNFRFQCCHFRYFWWWGIIPNSDFLSSKNLKVIMSRECSLTKI